MNAETKNFIKVWSTAAASLCYCYLIVSHIPRGFLRLLFILPIIFLFILLPFNLSSFHLGAPTIFYLVWLANFKLLLFSFDQGPLSSSSKQSTISLLHFIFIALLPIKTQQHPSPQSVVPKCQQPSFAKISSLRLYAVKVVLLSLVIYTYEYREILHPYVILGLYCCHVYLGVELVLAVTIVPVRAILGLELEPQFNEPYLATSLQDFWGRRWNLMVTSILRPTVYNPVRRILGPKWGAMPSILSTFVVSGLMHELIYFYLSRSSPTWEVTWFFVLHGVCVAAEVAVKKAVAGRWRLHRAFSGPLTVMFVAVTGEWLFFPQITRNQVDLKAINEYKVLVSFVKGCLPNCQTS